MTTIESARLKNLYRSPMEVARELANTKSNHRELLLAGAGRSRRLENRMVNLNVLAAEYAAMPEFAAELVEVAEFNAMIASIR